MKTMTLTCTIFAIVLCGAESLTLRGQPSLVQVRLPSPPNSSNEKDNKKALEDMEATLMRMAKSKGGGAGTPLKDFADLIIPHLDSMESAINSSHGSDQTTIDNLGAAFTACTTAKTTADSTANILLTTKTNQSQAHKDCRTAEGIADTAYSNCHETMISLEGSMNTACDAYTLANKVPNMNLVPQPGQGASYRSWLVSVRDWAINELANLDTANHSCVTATGQYDAKKLECEGADGNGGLKKVHSDLKTSCDSNQTNLEAAACSYAHHVEESCSDYGTCYANANTAYNSGKDNLLTAQLNRVNEYGLVKRLKCFCKLFSAAAGGDLNTADIDACKSVIHDTAHLNLTLPTVPLPPTPCAVVDQQPCTNSYTSTEYGSLPSNAQAKACQVCPHATTITTTAVPTTTPPPQCPDGQMYKDNACQQIPGNMKPTGVWVDASKNVFVNDCKNHQTMMYPAGFKSAVVVAGGNGAGSAMNQMNYPMALIVHKGFIYVSEWSNYLVAKWPLGGPMTKEIVAGGNGRGSALNQVMSIMNGITFDADDNMYIGDNHGCRVMKFPKGSTQSTMGEVIAGTGAKDVSGSLSGMAQASGIQLDSNGNLYVADRLRIMFFAKGSKSGDDGEVWAQFPTNINSVAWADNNFDALYVTGGDNKLYKAKKGSVQVMTSGGKWGSDGGIATDSSGNLYASFKSAHKVVKYSLDFSSYATVGK